MVSFARGRNSTRHGLGLNVGCCELKDDSKKRRLRTFRSRNKFVKSEAEKKNNPKPKPHISNPKCQMNLKSSLRLCFSAPFSQIFYRRSAHVGVAKPVCSQLAFTIKIPSRVSFNPTDHNRSHSSAQWRCENNLPQLLAVK